MRISDWSSDVCSSDLEFLRLDRRPGHLGHRHRLEHPLELGEDVAVRAGGLGRAHGQLLQATTGRQQADAGLDQADVAFQVRDRARTVHLELRSEEHTSELQSLMRISYAVFCLKKKNTNTSINTY